MSILGSHFNTQDLTEEEKRQYSKIVQLREKREKMQSNKKWRNEKENREANPVRQVSDADGDGP